MTTAEHDWGDLDRQLADLGQADIVVGIPSYNNARTIGHVVRAVRAGLARHFPERSAVLVNSDGGSTDGTPEAVRGATADDLRAVFVRHGVLPFQAVSVPYHGIPGKGSAFRTIFRAAQLLGAGACAVVDSDLRSITPEWMELLLRPVIEEGFHFVAPLYRRHKFDGTITNSIIYPLTRALYGHRVRQPIGGDFGFSGDLARHYLAQDVWGTDVARYGIDIWMTTTAVATGVPVCQAFLGAKLHDPKDPASDLSSMLRQVVGASFSLMETHHEAWRHVSGSTDVPTLGFRYDVGLDHVPVNTERMLAAFVQGVRDLRDVWSSFLPDTAAGALHRLSEAGPGAFRLPDETWAEIIYRAAIAFHRNTISRDHLLRSLTPLYLGKTASFVIEAESASPDEVEEMIERLCLAFERAKPLLMENWND
jgi:glycosyltransferase involved in cell wall biosynthesis